MSPWKTVGLIGTGLIGGSMALDIRACHLADTLLGYDKKDGNAAAAQRLGIVDRIVSYEELVAESDLIILSIPASAAAALLPDILDRLAARVARQTPDGLGPDASGSISVTPGPERASLPVVLDVCSVKQPIVDAVRKHPFRGRFVAGHPMSGTEYSGPQAARQGLFEGKVGIVCDAQDSDADALACVEALYEALGMRLVKMSAEQHDIHTAYVSHLSHVISFSLALTVLDKEKDDKHIFDLASGGFSSTARLAKSNADMWVPIFESNRENLLPVIDAYSDYLSRFRSAIASADGPKLRSLIETANRIQKIIQ